MSFGDTTGYLALLNYWESLRVGLVLEGERLIQILKSKPGSVLLDSSHAGIWREIQKIYGRDYPELITKTPRICDPPPFPPLRGTNSLMQAITSLHLSFLGFVG